MFFFSDLTIIMKTGIAVRKISWPQIITGIDIIGYRRILHGDGFAVIGAGNGIGNDKGFYVRTGRRISRGSCGGGGGG